MTIGQSTTPEAQSSRPEVRSTLRLSRIWRAGLAAAVALGALALAPPAVAVVVCGTPTTVGLDVVVAFTSSCSWTVPAGVTTVDALVVAGGGGGSTDGMSDSSGGGAGGLIYQTGVGNTGFAVSGASVAVTVGTGGQGYPNCSDGSNGTSSAFGSLVATGGGGGAGTCSSNSGNGYSGGSGGGAAVCYSTNRVGGAADTSGGQQAHAGGGVSSNYCSANGGGGGGGAGTAGASAGVPGAGVSISITGSAVTYAAGGAANSSFSYATQSPAAVYPTIGGGGRSSISGHSADSGAAGTVIIRYTVVVAPGTPGAPTAVAGDTRATVTVTAPSSGGTPASYTVTAVQSPFTSCTVTVPATSCIVTGLTNGTGYTFTSTATNTGGTSGASAASSPAVTPTLTTPGTPGTPTAVAGDTTATVTITAPGSGGAVASYTVTAVQSPFTSCTVTVPATSCTVTGLTDGTGYTFTSTATNTAGTSGASSASSPAVTPTLTTPGTPGTPTAVAGDGLATVTVVAPSTGGAVASYTVRVISDGSRSCTVTVPELSCPVVGLGNGASYQFEVSATNLAGTSTWSAPSLAVVPISTTSVPRAPSAVTVVAGPASLSVSWPAVIGATRYLATASPGPATCAVSTTSCVLGAVAGTTYTVTVVAQSAAGSSAASVASTPVTPIEPSVPVSPPDTAPATLTTDHGPIGVTTPGQKLTVIGTGFAPFSTTSVIIYSTPTTLGSAVTDATGAFSLVVTVPDTLAAGAHTFLASGVDPGGAPRLMVRPVTVAGDTGTGDTLPVPTGGTITLLDEAGLAVSTVTVPEGRYVLDEVTGVIDFVPVAGFTGTATGVRYRITDALGTAVTGTHTAVVTSTDPPIVGQALLHLPVRIIAGTGSHASAGVACSISSGEINECAVTASATVKGRRVSIGRGSFQPAAGQRLQNGTVPVVLTAKGRSLTARPGGVRVTFVAVVSQREHSGTSSARAATTVLARSFALPRSIRFRTGSAKVSASGARYLRSMRSRLAAATAITCVGHSDRRDGPAADRLGARRARAACAIIARDRHVVGHLVNRRDHAPTGARDTPAARAHNRRVDITVRN